MLINKKEVLMKINVTDLSTKQKINVRVLKTCNCMVEQAEPHIKLNGTFICMSCWGKMTDHQVMQYNEYFGYGGFDEYEED